MSQTQPAAKPGLTPTQQATANRPSGSQFKLKQRKREVVTKHEPEAFRDALLNLIPEDCDFEQYATILESAAEKLDFKRYADAFFEFAITGGLIAPGGQIVDDGARLNPFSIFACQDTTEAIRQRVDILNRLIRRFKYLQRRLEETMEHILQYVNKFGDNSHKLSVALGMFISMQVVSMGVLINLQKEHLVKEGTSLQFVTGVFQSYLDEQNIDHLSTLLKKSGMDDKLLEFFPPSKRQEEYLARHFEAEGLKSLVDFYKKRQGNVIKDQLLVELIELLEVPKSEAEIASFLHSQQKAHSLKEAEVLTILMDGIIHAEWNSKSDQIEAQITRSIASWPKVLANFCSSAKTEIAFLQRIQYICYEDARLTKHFQRIIAKMYEHDILSDSAILYWFEKGTLKEGKAMFLKQMEPFVEYLRENDDEDEEDDE
ncbi:hypothetical protein HK101_003381 [Irineochytrium annulatum]|nr:hypothetical protein HK101_003381 [Irineochytrium annulatum]